MIATVINTSNKVTIEDKIPLDLMHIQTFFSCPSGVLMIWECILNVPVSKNICNIFEHIE